MNRSLGGYKVVSFPVASKGKLLSTINDRKRKKIDVAVEYVKSSSEEDSHDSRDDDDDDDEEEEEEEEEKSRGYNENSSQSDKIRSSDIEEDEDEDDDDDGDGIFFRGPIGRMESRQNEPGSPFHQIYALQIKRSNQMSSHGSFLNKEGYVLPKHQIPSPIEDPEDIKKKKEEEDQIGKKKKKLLSFPCFFDKTNSCPPPFENEKTYIVPPPLKEEGEGFFSGRPEPLRLTEIDNVDEEGKSNKGESLTCCEDEDFSNLKAIKRPRDENDKKEEEKERISNRNPKRRKLDPRLNTKKK